ncbi:uncharacterized protein LOC130673821 [Microplitis mediator]|uniref:uncharacterized protein LOC130673821 n=1 Tax=Microplitis mediator TaxID=375433 RepID=UPI0025556DA7|nr:uncharacterized protein LOC130673821 [Microplitis mediator]
MDILPDDLYSISGHKHLRDTKLPYESDVLHYINNLPSEWSSGMDGIPYAIVKDCAKSLAYLRTIVISSRMSAGVYPQSWKEAKVYPIHKSEDKYDDMNYRPISIIPTFANVFETMLYDLIL